MIIDTEPLYASLNRSDRSHSVCRNLIETATEQTIVPAPVLVEVNRLVLGRTHPGVFLALLDDVSRGTYLVHNLVPQDYYPRIRDLCDRYADADIGFVDAAVLAIVERLNEPKLATLDHRHFGMLRPRHVDALRLLPE